MLFYAALFLFSLAISAVIVWLIRSLSSARKSGYQAILPSARGNAPARTVAPESAPTEAARTPWGWSRESMAASKRGRAAPRDSVLDRIWHGASHPAPESPAVGWPYRDEPNEFRARQYRVVRKRRTRRSSGKPGKPWGW